MRFFTKNSVIVFFVNNTANLFFFNQQVNSRRTTSEWFSWSYHYECRSSPIHHLVRSRSKGHSHRYRLADRLSGVSRSLSDGSVGRPRTQRNPYSERHHPLGSEPHQRQYTVCSLHRCASVRHESNTIILNQY